MLILFHSSKTMKPQMGPLPIAEPALLDKAQMLVDVVASLSVESLVKVMGISSGLADKVAEMYEVWRMGGPTTSAATTFVGDMYSGLQVSTWSREDWLFAEDHFRILSGLYGVLRPSDGLRPYRLEMAYRLPGVGSLYDFWSDSITGVLPPRSWVLDLSVPEYTKAVLPYLSNQEAVVRPTFLTQGSDGQPKPVVVHAKIARGAMARWAIQERVVQSEQLSGFDLLNYAYDASLSKPGNPVFVCQQFGGLGLSVRLD